MDIGAIVAWIQANWVKIAEYYAAFVTLSSIIVKITPTLKDDNILLGIIKFMSKYFALNRTVDDEAIRKTIAK
jgi:hypothetical protein